MYLVSVYFDEKSSKILKKHIDRVAERTGNSFMTEHQVPPHLTIAAIEARSAEVLLPAFRELTKSGICPGGTVPIVSIGQLLPYVMYVTPVLNEYLSDLNKKVNEVFGQIDETSINRFYRTGNWLPHITIGKTLTKEQMRVAFNVLSENFVPFEATVTRIGLSQVNPHRDVEVFDGTHTCNP